MAHLDLISTSDNIQLIFESMVGLLAVGSYSYFGRSAILKQTDIVVRFITFTMDRTISVLEQMSFDSKKEAQSLIYSQLM